MLTSILNWYFALQLLAVAGLPLAFFLFRHLPSRGYATAKALGLLLTGIIFWWGNILHLWTNTSAAVLSAAAIVFCAGLLLMRGRWEDVGPWWSRHRAHVFSVEGLFLISLLVWALVRASQPHLQTAGGEKWMEIAFLNAGLRAPSLPPHDPWLSGFTISYYYLGYVLLALVTRLSMLASSVAFNLGNAGWFALAAVQAYGLVYDLLGGEMRDAIRALLAPLLLLVTGNGQGIFEVFHARGLFPPRFWEWLDINRLTEPPQPPFSWVPQRFFWWWQASRTLRDRTPWGDHQEVIDEFPAFSFLLGDMHPHLLALPFVLLIVALAYNVFLGETRKSEDVGHADVDHADVDHADVVWADVGSSSLLRRWLPVVGMAVILGSLGFLNTWDLPIYWALLVGAWILGRYVHVAERSFRAAFQTALTVVPDALVLGVLSVVAYVPFWIALRSQAGGILPNVFNATQIQHFVIMFLPLLVPVIGVIVSGARRRGVDGRQALLWGIALMLMIALVALIVGSVAAYPYLGAILRGESVQGYSLPPDVALAALRSRVLNPWVGLLLAIGVSTVLFALVARPRARKEEPPVEVRSDATFYVFPLLLVMLGLLLTLAPEFVYLQDVFMTRMNTIFKFYFQAWVLWSLAGAWQLARWLKVPPSRGVAWRRVGIALSTFGILVGLVYTVLAVPARAREQGVPWTLDGMAWLESSFPSDYAAITWLNTHIKGAPVIIEAPGDQRKAYVYEGRVSALTGLPTPLGWGGHQMQWRGNYEVPARREQDLNLLFSTQDQDVVREILARYEAVYLYIGPLERQRYAAEGLDKFDAMFPAVYDQDGVTIYQVAPTEHAGFAVPDTLR
jgi:YYY domain-containing protein